MAAVRYLKGSAQMFQIKKMMPAIAAAAALTVSVRDIDILYQQ